MVKPVFLELHEEYVHVGNIADSVEVRVVIRIQVIGIGLCDDPHQFQRIENWPDFRVTLIRHGALGLSDQDAQIVPIFLETRIVRFLDVRETPCKNARCGVALEHLD